MLKTEQIIAEEKIEATVSRRETQRKKMLQRQLGSIWFGPEEDLT